MRRALRAVREARNRADARTGARLARPETEGLDADRAALVGVEVSPLMTTLGSLESKRLATDPRWAGALVRQFADHGIGTGATVVASFSGSFPGLNLAVMAACRAMGLRLVAISSVTASTFGANEPGFTWPEMEVIVAGAGVLPAASAGVSIGGTRDAGRDLSDEGREIARRIQRETARALGARVLDATTLERAITLRQEVYEAAVGGKAPAVYVNVGGNHASLGGARAPFRREEGWLGPRQPAGAPAAGAMAAWMEKGVPALNLLDIKALARAWGLE